MRHRPLPARSARPRRERRPAGFSLAGSFAGSFLAVTVVHVVALPSFAGLLTVAFVVGLCSIDATWAATVGVAVLGWLFLNGFVTNTLGELHLHGSGDEWRLALLLSVAVAVSAASRSALRAHVSVGGSVAAGPTAGPARVSSPPLLDCVTGVGALAARRSAADAHTAQ